MEKVTDFIFLGSKITADCDCSHEFKRHLLLGRKSYDKQRQVYSKAEILLYWKSPSSQSYGFHSSHIWIWELDHKESYGQRIDAFEMLILEKTLESPLNRKEIKPINCKRNQSWIFFGSTETEDEAPRFWPPDAKNWLIGKDLDGGKDWRQEEKQITEDDITGWCHQWDGHEFEQTPGDGKGQGSLACCIPWGCNVSDMIQ